MARTQLSEKDFLEKITQIIEDNLIEGQIGVSELAREMGMVRTSLHRRVKFLTGASVSQFIREIRLKKAMDLLRETSLPISEVAFECGFHSVTYFTTCFHDHYGYPPSKAGKGEAEENNSEEIRHPDVKSGILGKRLYIAILGSALFIIIILLVLFFVFQPFNSRDQSLEKSIAVLPFVNDSPDDENAFFLNGILNDLTLNLQTIRDLRVPGRTSVENYRITTKSIPEIAKELNVDYLVEGSGQKYGNTVKLSVKLLAGVNDEQLWAASYEVEVRKPEDIYRIQSQITQSIVEKLEAVITDKEKQLIEKIPTSNLFAYEFYQKGLEESWKYWDKKNKEALNTAAYLYSSALEYDPTFAQVYVSLAWNYAAKVADDSILADDYLDSALILADQALSYDNQLAEAYRFKGYYFTRKGKPSQAIIEFDSALKLNPNERATYHNRAMLYHSNDDLVRAISDWHDAISLDPITELNLRSSSRMLKMLGENYGRAGFNEKAKHYIQKAFMLDKDSANYYSYLSLVEGYAGNFEKAIELGDKAIAQGMTPLLEVRISRKLGKMCLFISENEESLKYFERSIEVNQSVGAPIEYYSAIGFAYRISGDKNMAEYYINEQIKYSNSRIELGREFKDKYWALYSLAGAYAFMGQKDKAYENLHKFNKRQRMCLQEVHMINNDPLFDNMRDEPEFQQIVREVEAKYQIEHERVRKWLEENDML
jgi:TolB-like protein/AraC-like DNA-binding protein/Flp pilus assembly protein TadD